MLLQSIGYHPIEKRPAPVHIEINLDVDDVDRSSPIPKWTYSISVRRTDGQSSEHGGDLEALDEQSAKLRVYGETIDLVARLLATEISSVPPPTKSALGEAYIAGYYAGFDAGTSNAPNLGGEPGAKFEVWLKQHNAR